MPEEKRVKKFFKPLLGEVKDRKFLKTSLVFAMAWFALSALLNDFLISIIAAIALAGILHYFASGSEKRLARKRARIIESDLPFTLLSMSAELNYNSNFEKVLEHAASQKKGMLSEGMKKALREVKNSGASMQEALSNFSESFDSTSLKRAVSQIISVFEHGNKKAGAENLKKLALELLARQRIESKEFNAKLSVLSLMFISLSAVLPALFQAFVIVGSTFMELEFTPLELMLVSVVAFPAVNIGILYFIKESTPEFLKG